MDSHRKPQLEDRLKAGPRWQERGYVFPSRYGTLMNPDNLRKRYLKPLLEEAGLPPLTFHEFRHTFASLLLHRKKHMKVVQSLLGHSSITQTMDTYSHLAPGTGEDASESLRGLLFGPE
jgi:integrase